MIQELRILSEKCRLVELAGEGVVGRKNILGQRRRACEALTQGNKSFIWSRKKAHLCGAQ